MTVDIEEGQALFDRVSPFVANDDYGNPAIWTTPAHGTPFIVRVLIPGKPYDNMARWMIENFPALADEVRALRKALDEASRKEE